MKTFEEALEAVGSQDFNLLSENLASGREYISNDSFKLAIQSLVDAWVKNTMKLQDPLDLYALAYATLHGAFHFGLLVGMEMEKVQRDGGTK